MRKNSFMKKLTAFILAGMLLLLTAVRENYRTNSMRKKSKMRQRIL